MTDSLYTMKDFRDAREHGTKLDQSRLVAAGWSFGFHGTGVCASCRTGTTSVTPDGFYAHPRCYPRAASLQWTHGVRATPPAGHDGSLNHDGTGYWDWRAVRRESYDAWQLSIGKDYTSCTRRAPVVELTKKEKDTLRRQARYESAENDPGEDPH